MLRANVNMSAYIKAKKDFDRIFFIYRLAFAMEIIVVMFLLLVIGGTGIAYFIGFISIPVVGYAIINLASSRCWHCCSNDINMLISKKIKVLTYGVAVLIFIITAIGAFISISCLFFCFYLISHLGDWKLLFHVIFFGVSVAVMPFVLYYLIQYFKYFRWTWEELQLPPKERKAQYKATKLAEKQKRKEEREAKRLAAANSRAAKAAERGKGRYNFNNVAGRSSVVAGMTQTDRRSELENLKKLYEDGLIDEEEYKKAREKALGIK